MPPAKRTRRDRNTEAVDDYLKAIYALGGDDHRLVGGTELASRLSVTPASVTNMLQKLGDEAHSLIEYQRSRGVRLTSAGHKKALEIVRHHRLLETFLFRVLNYPLDEIHDEAERLEHFISESFEERIAANLGNPTADPHGHCIPAMDGTMPEAHGISCRCGL